MLLRWLRQRRRRLGTGSIVTDTVHRRIAAVVVNAVVLFVGQLRMLAIVFAGVAAMVRLHLDGCLFGERQRSGALVERLE